MAQVLKKNYNNNICRLFYENILYNRGSLYYFLGRSTAWDDDSMPDTPDDSVNYDYNTRNNISYVSKINISDISYVIPRRNWRANTIYNKYNSYSTQESSFVLTNDFNVYICIDNNNDSESTSTPIGNDVEIITLEDGYRWKYIYSIPIGFRDRFLTSNFMPVFNASNFGVDGGQIANISIKNNGRGYNIAELRVIGNGQSEVGGAIEITGLYSEGINFSPFNDYNIEDPVDTSKDWVQRNDFSVINGEILKSNNLFYRVLSSSGEYDTTGLTPNHLNGASVYNGLSLSLVAERVDIGYNHNTNENTLINGRIKSIPLLTSDPVYQNIPDVVIEYNSERMFTALNFNQDTYSTFIPATAQAVMHNGRVSYININDGGHGYVLGDDISVKVGTEWSAGITLTEGDEIFHGANLYRCYSDGTLSNTPPTSVDPSFDIDNTIRYVGRACKADTPNLTFGYGYNIPTELSVMVPMEGSTGLVPSTGSTFLLSENTSAEVIPIINNNQIEDVLLVDRGRGYSGDVRLEVSGDGMDADFDVNINIGRFNTFQFNSEILAVDGQINHIEVINGGSGYDKDAPPNVSIIGDGTGAVAVAQVNDVGVVESIQIDDYGKDYRYANIIIDQAVSDIHNTNADVATARAYISPIGGHGHNPIRDTNATSIMTYSDINVSDLNNDYRQYGIIYDIKNFTDNLNFNKQIGLYSYKLLFDSIPSIYSVDSIVMINNRRFVIINIDDDTMSVLSSDNYSPVIGDMVTSNNLNSIEIKEVTPPDVDKYSGDIMFINNRLPFNVNVDQRVAVRSIFNF